MILRCSIQTIALCACAIALAAAPARAAFCGPAGDVAAVEKLTIQAYGKASQASHTIDDSYVRIIDVSGNYAYSLTDEDAGPIAFYWNKQNGAWAYVPGAKYPATWPAAIRDGFDKVGTGMLSGNTLCTNPNWKSRSSG
jgi:hypothetical protein